MYSTTDFRKGLKIEIGGEPFIITDFQHVKPGKGGAFVRTKIKSLSTGNVLDKTFRSGDKVDRPDMEEKEMEYLYNDGDNYYFMDQQTYEQIGISTEILGSTKNFLPDNISTNVLFHNNVPLTVEVPNFVVLEIAETEPGVKGDTAAGGTKPAKLVTGVVVQVPLFLNEGEKIKVDTRTCQYAERA